MRAILTTLTAILLLLPAPARAQSVLRIGLNDDPDALDPKMHGSIMWFATTVQRNEMHAAFTNSATISGGGYFIEELRRGAQGTMPFCSQPAAFVEVYPVPRRG